MKRPRTRRPGVACPHCGEAVSEVEITTPVEGQVTRRRRCRSCSRTYGTTESADLTSMRTIYTGVKNLANASLQSHINK